MALKFAGSLLHRPGQREEEKETEIKYGEREIAKRKRDGEKPRGRENLALARGRDTRTKEEERESEKKGREDRDRWASGIAWSSSSRIRTVNTKEFCLGDAGPLQTFPAPPTLPFSGILYACKCNLDSWF